MLDEPLLKRLSPYTVGLRDLSAEHNCLTDVVIVAPGYSVLEGLGLCRSLSGRRACLVAYGVGQLDEELLAGVDLGAFFSSDPVSDSQSLLNSFRRWLGSRFSASWAPQLGEDLYGAACCRFFQTYLEAGLFWKNLNTFCSGKQVHILGSFSPWGLSWGQMARPRTWRLQLAIESLGCLGLTCAKMSLDFFRRRGLLNRLKDFERTREEPQAWFLLHHEWDRLNHHILEELVLPRLRRGESVGLLLWGDLLPGGRRESDLKLAGKEFFAGIRPVLDFPGQVRMHQVSWPQEAQEMMACLIRLVSASLLNLFGLLRQPSVLREGEFVLDLASVRQQLARLNSIELGRAIAAEQRMDRVSLPESVQIFSSGSSSGAARTVDRLLQQRGHATLEFFHGGGGEDWLGAAESPSSARLVWTEVDAAVVNTLGQRALAGGNSWWREKMPRTLGKGPIRLLLATNYLHRDYRLNGNNPYEAYLKELLLTCSLLEARRPGEFVWRWRRHPAESEQTRHLLESFLQQPGCEVADTSLSEDIAWADGLVSTMSSVVLEALGSNIPVFLHFLPRFEATGYVRAFESERKFFGSEAGARLIAGCFGRNVGQPSLEPERKARCRFFGPSGRPRSLSETDAVVAPHQSFCRG